MFIPCTALYNYTRIWLNNLFTTIVLHHIYIYIHAYLQLNISGWMIIAKAIVTQFTKLHLIQLSVKFQEIS